MVLDENSRLKGLNHSLELRIEELVERTQALQQIEKKIITLGIDREPLLGIENVLKELKSG